MKWRTYLVMAVVAGLVMIPFPPPVAGRPMCMAPDETSRDSGADSDPVESDRTEDGSADEDERNKTLPDGQGEPAGRQQDPPGPPGYITLLGVPFVLGVFLFALMWLVLVGTGTRRSG
jgi:hypothetical protein